MLVAGVPDAPPCPTAAVLAPPISSTVPPPLYLLTLGVLEYWRQLAGGADPTKSPAVQTVTAGTAAATDSIRCPQCHPASVLLTGGGGQGADPCGLGLAPRYSLLRCIGKGAFSRVYLVRDHWRRQHWAMKVSEHPFERLASREAALLLGPLSGLPSAPHCQGGLIRLSGGRVALLLEHLTPIAGRWAGNSRPPWQFLLADCARCLAKLHACGLLHGDIKPDNIMCAEAGTIRPRFKLIDYGNCMSQEELLVYYGDSGEVASLRYRAPEALVGLRSALGTALDIWSLGVTLAQLLVRDANEEQAHAHERGQGQSWNADRNGQEPRHGDAKPPHMPSLFVGTTEREMVEELIELNGPLPDHFGKGSRWEALGRPALRSACRQGAAFCWQHWARSNWARLLGIRDGLLLDVLTGMLQLNPAERLTAQDILQHP